MDGLPEVVDALSKAWRGIRQSAIRPDARLFDLEVTLAASSDERLRWLALAALIAQSAQASGWSYEAIARLEKHVNILLKSTHDSNFCMLCKGT